MKNWNIIGTWNEYSILESLDSNNAAATVFTPELNSLTEGTLKKIGKQELGIAVGRLARNTIYKNIIPLQCPLTKEF